MAYVGAEYLFTPAATDRDGQPLTFSITNKPAWVSFDEASGTITGTPAVADLGVHVEIVISVTDGIEYAFLPVFSIEVVPEQPPPGGGLAPTISGSPPTSVQTGQRYSFRPTASDPEGQPLSFAVANKPAWASFDAATGELYGTPSADDVGTHSGVSISVSDGVRSSTLPAFAINVSDSANAPPVISGSPATVVSVGTSYVFEPDASDPDGDPITFVATNKPSWMNFDTRTGRLSGVATESVVGTYDDIRIIASDGKAASSLPKFSLMVTTDPVPPPPPPPPPAAAASAATAPAAAGNSAPSISGTPATAVNEGQAYSFQPTASDPDGDALTFSVSGAPTWAIFNAGTGRLSGTPPKGAAGSYPGISISVSDGAATATLPAFSITVNVPANSAPTISGTPVTTVQAGQPYSFQPSASDDDSATLRFGIAGKPAWASFDETTGRLWGTPVEADIGTHTNIVISVSDGVSSASLPSFSITVTGIVRGSAELSWTAPTQNEDGSALTNLAGYKVRYGTSAADLDTVLDVPGASTTDIVIEDLTAGTWYFTVASYTNTGVQSAPAGPVYKTIQ